MTLLKIVSLLLTLALVVGSEYEVTVSELPENPHEYMNKEGACFDCHTSYLDEVDPHVFVIDVIEDCLQEKCHSTLQNQMTRGHPVGVDPYDSGRSIKEVPEELPLHDDELTCGTCHNPHLERLSQSKSSRWDEPAFLLESFVEGRYTEKEYFYTYFLRVHDARSDYSNEKLCLSCHNI